MTRVTGAWGLAALVALSFGVGCSKCGKATEAPAGVERVLPKGSVGVVVVPSVEALGKKVSILEALKVTGFVAQLQGFASGKQFADALVNELGIDVRSAEAMEKAGVDGQRDLGAAVLITGHAYLALPVKDAAKLHTALESLANRRLGAGAGGEQKTGEVVVKTFSAQHGKPPRLGYVLARGYALVATDDAIGQLAMMATLTETDALSTDAQLKAAQARLAGERDVYAWLPPGSPVLGRFPVTSALVTASLSPKGLAVAVDAPWKGDAAQLAVLESKPGPDLLGLLPRDAFLVLRFLGHRQRLAPFADELLGPHLSKAFREAGFDVKAEVLQQLKPGAVAALSLAERPPMDRGLPTLDIRQTNPFTYAHLSGAAPLTSRDTAWPTLDKVAAVAPRFGAKMEKAEREGGPALITTYAQGEGVHFAVKGDAVLFASPVMRLDALVKRDGQGGSPVAGLGDDAVSAVVDLTRLSQSVRALPESAWGIGGFAIKATTVRWLDATDDLKAITLGVGAKHKAVQARVTLSLGDGRSEPSAVISARGLSRSYDDGERGQVRVLDDVSLEVAAGEFVAVVGRSGSGKSTLLHVLGGLDTGYRGQVTVAGTELAGLGDRALSRFRNEQVGFVFQSFHLVQGLSARDNVALPSFFAPALVPDAEGRALEALTRVGLDGKAQRLPSQLSGGERQRVAIARALFARPKVLLCDEPTGNLDSTTSEQVVALFQELNRAGLTVLAVTHEDRLRGAASRVLTLADGRLVNGAALRKLVRLSLSRERRATTSSVFGVGVGIASLVFFVALGLGVGHVVREKVFPVDASLVEVVPSQLSLGLLGGKLDQAAVDRLAALPGVEIAYRKMSVRVPAVSFYDGDFFGRRLRMGIEVLAVGVDPDFVRADVKMGEFSDPGEGQPIPSVAATRLLEIYNKSFAQARGLPQLSPGMVTGFSFPVDWNRSFVAETKPGPVTRSQAQIVGVSDRGLLAGIVIPLDVAKRLNAAAGADASTFTGVALKAVEPSKVPGIVEGVKAMGLRVDDQDRRMAENAGAAVAITTSAMALLSLLICVLAAFNIAHALSASVRARERELGVMRAVGASRADVFRLVMAEATVLGLLGGAGGTLLALAAALGVDMLAARVMPEFPFKPDSFFALPPWLFLGGVALGVLAAVAGAWLPARRASAVDPARVLAGQVG